MILQGVHGWPMGCWEFFSSNDDDDDDDDDDD